MDTLRKQLIMAKALAYAIETIQKLPPRWQEASDCADMKILLDDMHPRWKHLAVASARHHLSAAKDVEVIMGIRQAQKYL